jgi:uncharacterized membrane protein YgaE (UPF0421/DUF939 family)
VYSGNGQLRKSPLAALNAGWHELSYALLTSATAITALYVAMWLELATPRWALLTVVIVSPPVRGDAIRKSMARLAGTPIGCVAAVVLTAVFPQNAVGYVIGLSVWMGGCAFVATRAQEYAAYAATLAGFTVAVVGLNTSSQPQQIFYAATDRGAETIVGVLAALMASVTVTGGAIVVDTLPQKVRQLASSVMQWAEDVVHADAPPIDLPLADAVIVKLPAQIANAKAERPALRRVGMWVQGLPTALVDLQCTALALASSKAPEARIARAVARVSLSRCREILSGASVDISSLESEEINLAVLGSRLHGLSPGAVEIIATSRFVLVGIVAMAQLQPPDSSPPLFPPITIHRRWAVSFAAFVRTALGIFVAFAIWDATAWEYGNVLLSFSAVLIAAITIADDAAQAFRGAVVSCAAGCVLGILTLFLLLPTSSSFVWLALVLLPLVAIGPWMQAAGHPPAQGILFATGFSIVLSPTNPQQYLLSHALEETFALLLAAVIAKCVFAIVDVGGNGRQRICYYLNALWRSALTARAIGAVDRTTALTWQSRALDQFRCLAAAGADSGDRKAGIRWILEGRAAMQAR